MFKQAFAGKAFKLGTAAPVVGKRMNGNAAAGGEIAIYFDVFGIHQGNQVFHDDVDTVFMEIAMVAEAEQIEFQGFAFDHFDIGNVADVNGGKVRLAGHRA